MGYNRSDREARTRVLAKTEVAPTQGLSALIREGAEIAGRYRVISLIGEGGMGAVYRAEHLHLRKIFALKVLQPRNVDRPDIAARFEREAIVAARIEHPNVVPATDFGRLPDGSFFLVLEFVNGKSLKSELKSGPMPVPRALGIMRGVVAGVRAAHEKGVIHRDLKPENIMLVERDGNRDFVKLLDFGVAGLDARTGDAAAALTEIGTVLGTPHYMSPEQILGRAVDARSDLYALGVVFYEILTGRCPFTGNLQELLAQHATAPPPELPADIVSRHPRLAEILRTLFAKQPEERFQTARELGAALDEVWRQIGATSHARAISRARAPGGGMQRAAARWRELRNRVRPSWSKFAASTSAVASRGIASFRSGMARLVRRAPNGSPGRTHDRRVARTVVAARKLGRGSMILSSKLVTSARALGSKLIEALRRGWRGRSRRLILAVGCAAALGLIVVIAMAMYRGPAEDSRGHAKPTNRGSDARPARARPARP